MKLSELKEKESKEELIETLYICGDCLKKFVNIDDCESIQKGVYCPFCFSKRISSIYTKEFTEKKEAPSHDVVNHPSHYTQGKVECIDAIESACINKQGIEAVCVANVIKYLWRYENKNGVEDVKKAKWYLERLIEGLEKNKE